MTVSAHHQRQDQRVAAQTVDRSPAWLKTETEDRQYQILASLLSGELKRITPAFRPRHFPPDPIHRSVLRYRPYPNVRPLSEA